MPAIGIDDAVRINNALRQGTKGYRRDNPARNNESYARYIGWYYFAMRYAKELCNYNANNIPFVSHEAVGRQIGCPDLVSNYTAVIIESRPRAPARALSEAQQSPTINAGLYSNASSAELLGPRALAQL